MASILDFIGLATGSTWEEVVIFNKKIDALDLENEAAKQQQRLTWHLPPKTIQRRQQVVISKYQKIFKGHLFPVGKKK